MNTYPEMDAKIVGILRLGDEPAHLYAAQRIEELAGALDEARRANERLAGALIALVGDEPPVADLTNGHPWAGCAYCNGPHYHSRYQKRLGSYRGEHGKEPPPEPGEDEYAPFTEHKAWCPWEAARAARAALAAAPTPAGEDAGGAR